MAQDYVNRATVDNDFDPSDRNQQSVVTKLAGLTGLLSGLYQTNSIQNAIACSTEHPAAIVLCPNGIVINGMLVATPDQQINIALNQSTGAVTLTVDGNTTTLNLAEFYATKEELDALLEAQRAMVLVGALDASTGRLTDFNADVLSHAWDMTKPVIIEQHLAWNESTFASDTYTVDGETYNFNDFLYLPTLFKTASGWSFRVSNAGSIRPYPNVEVKLEAGDMITIVDGNGYYGYNNDSIFVKTLAKSALNVVQNNVDVATSSSIGLVKVPQNGGLVVGSDGAISIGTVSMTTGQSAGVTYITLNIGGNISQTIQLPDVSSYASGLMNPRHLVKLDNAALAYYFTDSAQWSIQSIFADNISAETLYTTLSAIDKEATIYIRDYASNGRMGWVELHRGGQTNDATTRGTKQSYYAIVTDDDGEAYLYSFDVKHTGTPAAYNLYLHKNHERIVLDSDINGELNLTNQMFNYRTTARSQSVADKAHGDIAKIKALYGNTIVWNQLIGVSSKANFTSSGVTYTNNHDGSWTLNGTSTARATLGLGLQNIQFIGGHKYALLGSKGSGFYLYIESNNNPTVYDSGNGVIFEPSSSTSTSPWTMQDSGVTFNNYTIYPQIYDLSLMFGLGKEPTLAQFKAWLAEYYPRKDYMYNAGTLVNVAPEAIKTIGFNLWDEEWELGYYGTSSGVKSASTSQICSKNLIPVFPNTQYYRSGGISANMAYILFYDINKQKIDVVSQTRNFLTPSNAAYISLTLVPSYGTTYNHDVTINLAWSGKRNGEYEEHWEETTQIDVKTLKGKRSDGTVEVMFPNGLKALDDVHDEMKGNKAIKRIGKFVPTTNTVWARSPYTVDGTEVYRFLHIVSDGLKTNNTKNYAACGKYASTRYIYVLQHTNDKQIALFGSEDGTRCTIGINDDSYTDVDSFKAAIAGTPIYYVLDTPIEYDLDTDFEIDYKCDDYGTEQILPYDENIPTTLPIIADIEYGLNILDTISRLHLDYVSVHKQTLSELEQAQARANIGVEDHAKVLSVDIQRLVAKENTGDDDAYIVLKELQSYRVDTGNIVFARYNGEYGIVTYVAGTEGMGYRFIGDDKYYEWVFDGYDDGDKRALVIFNEKLDGVNYHVQTLTQAQYDALTTKDPRTVYLITDQQWYEQYTTLAQLITALNNAGIGNIQSISVVGTALSPDASKNVNIPSSDGNAFGVVKIVLPNDFAIANKEMTVVEGNESDVVTTTAMKRVYDAINTRLKAIEDALTWQAYPQS